MTNDLRIRKLSQILDKVIDYRGKTPKKLGGEWSHEGYRALSALNVKSSGLDNLDQARFLDEEMYRKWMKDEVKRGDILLTSEAPSGQVLYWDSDEKIVLSQRLFCLRVNENHDSKFISYYLKSDIGQKAIFDKGSGSTVSGISAKMFDYISVITYEKDKEKAISKVLSDIDEKISLNVRINEELLQTARLIYDYWFTQFDFPDSKGKPYKSSGGKMVYSNRLKYEIPEGWECVDLGNITLNHDSKRIPLSRNQREKRAGNYPYYGATSVVDYIDDFIFDGDYILVAEDGSIEDDNGFVVTQLISGKSWVNNHAHVLEPKGVYSCLMISLLLSRIPASKVSTGSVQPKINQENLNTIPIVEAPVAVRQKYISITEPLYRKIIANEIEIQELTKLRDWILPMLITGQIMVEK